jgi:hypothetical protein
MRNSADKVKSSGNPNVMVCERGTMFGYGDLIVDPRNLMWMRDAHCPVVRVLSVFLQTFSESEASFWNPSDSSQISRTPYNSRQGDLLAMVALPAVASVR